MPETPDGLMRELMERMVRRDLDGMLELFHPDAVLFDPHYPVQRMEGIAAIERGLRWGLQTLAEPGFTIRHVWLDGNKGAVEVDTHHVLANGMKLNFEQVFLFEADGGRITRIRAFVPNPPPGLGGWIPVFTRLWWRIRG